MDTLTQDIRFALRTFRKNPGFTAVALLTLALGIGANTAIFSVVNAVLIRALPYEQPESLVVLWGNVQRAVVERRGASYPDAADWRAQNRSFEDLAVYSDETYTHRERRRRARARDGRAGHAGVFQAAARQAADRPRVRRERAPDRRRADRHPRPRALDAPLRRQSVGRRLHRSRCPIARSRSSASCRAGFAG